MLRRARTGAMVPKPIPMRAPGWLTETGRMVSAARRVPMRARSRLIVSAPRADVSVPSATEAAGMEMEVHGMVTHAKKECEAGGEFAYVGHTIWDAVSSAGGGGAQFGCVGRTKSDVGKVEGELVSAMAFGGRLDPVPAPMRGAAGRVDAVVAKFVGGAVANEATAGALDSL